MSKRKFKKGRKVETLDDFIRNEWFIVCGKTYHSGWCRSWSIQLALRYINRGVAFIAERLTNEEYYSGKTDEQLVEIIGEERLCNFCPLPEEQKGVHCYGGNPVMCEGTHCDKALSVWKEEYVE